VLLLFIICILFRSVAFHRLPGLICISIDLNADIDTNVIVSADANVDVDTDTDATARNSVRNTNCNA
jgi:hypothetical protein